MEQRPRKPQRASVIAHESSSPVVQVVEKDAQTRNGQGHVRAVPAKLSPLETLDIVSHLRRAAFELVPQSLPVGGREAGGLVEGVEQGSPFAIVRVFGEDLDGVSE